LGSLTAANWVSFDFNVSYSSCWGYSLINTLKLKKIPPVQERRLTRRDKAGLPQPARAGLLASASGARETHAAQETTVAGVSFFAVLSHIARSQHKRRISHQTSNRNRNTSAGDWRWRVYTNNVATTTTNGADLLSCFLWSLAKL